MFRRTIQYVIFIFASSMVSNASMADATLNIKGKSGQDTVLQVKDGIGRMNTPGDKDYIVFNSKTGIAG